MFPGLLRLDMDTPSSSDSMRIPVFEFLYVGHQARNCGTWWFSWCYPADPKGMPLSSRVLLHRAPLLRSGECFFSALTLIHPVLLQAMALNIDSWGAVVLCTPYIVAMHILLMSAAFLFWYSSGHLRDLVVCLFKFLIQVHENASAGLFKMAAQRAGPQLLTMRGV